MEFVTEHVEMGNSETREDVGEYFLWELDLDGMGMSACSCSCGMTSPRYQRWQRLRSHRANNVHQAMLFRLMGEAIFTNCIDNAQC